VVVLQASSWLDLRFGKMLIKRNSAYAAYVAGILINVVGFAGASEFPFQILLAWWLVIAFRL
jgi:hypothetical protein